MQLGSFGFDKTVYGNYKKKKGRKKWYGELQEEQTRDMQTKYFMTGHKH
ncbi:MAG: hypothetical protein WBL88_17895 [Nitrososphaeraceae archaeon]